MRILLGRVKGDKGERGAQGPRGPRGERGPQGPPGEPGQTDIYTRAESDERYQLKGGASVESFYQWLKERNYNMNNFRGLETIFPVITLQAVDVETIEEGDTELVGTAPPNVKIMYGGKTTVSDNDGNWILTGLASLKQGEITIQWIDYAGRTNSAKVELTVCCVPKGTEAITKEVVAQYNLNRSGLLKFPKSVKIIKDSAFSQCSRLSEVSFPACTTVEEAAFYHCSSLTSISMPQCTSIGTGSFSGCGSLETIILSEKWKPTDNAVITRKATVYNQDKTKKVNWNTMSWVRA